MLVEYLGILLCGLAHVMSIYTYYRNLGQEREVVSNGQKQREENDKRWAAWVQVVHGTSMRCVVVCTPFHINEHQTDTTVVLRILSSVCLCLIRCCETWRDDNHISVKDKNDGRWTYLGEERTLAGREFECYVTL